jgi:hypothetical protein
MSRFTSSVTRLVLTCSLVTSFASSAFAGMAPHFARPPSADQAAPVDRDPPAEPAPDMRIMPRALDRATVRDALARARTTNLTAFRAYQKAGVFPSNTFAGGKLNVWRDRDGHLCAAATIIEMSGQVELVGRVAEQSNFIRLADVRQGPLMDWILTSGFTQDEIAAIQEPFMPVADRPVPVSRPDPVLVDARMRARENARLRAKYILVERDLVKHERASLDLATDRLMKQPALAARLVGLVDAID